MPLLLPYMCYFGGKKKVCYSLMTMVLITFGTYKHDGVIIITHRDGG
jgi:hypothetical protein